MGEEFNVYINMGRVLFNYSPRGLQVTPYPWVSQSAFPNSVCKKDFLFYVFYLKSYLNLDYEYCK